MCRIRHNYMYRKTTLHPLFNVLRAFFDGQGLFSSLMSLLITILKAS